MTRGDNTRITVRAAVHLSHHSRTASLARICIRQVFSGYHRPAKRSHRRCVLVIQPTGDCDNRSRVICASDIYDKVIRLAKSCERESTRTSRPIRYNVTEERKYQDILILEYIFQRVTRAFFAYPRTEKERERRHAHTHFRFSRNFSLFLALVGVSSSVESCALFFLSSSLATGVCAV